MTDGGSRAATPLRRLSTSEPVLAAVLGVVLAAVAWLRLDPTTRGTVWAEDGVVFLAEREGLGPWQSLFHVYAGYLHLAPRLMSDVAGLVAPVELYAVTVTALCCLVLGAVSSLVFLCTAGLVGSVAIRVAIASTTVLVPAGSIETMGNLANVHWYVLWLAPWLLLARVGRWRHAVALGLVALLAGLTEIQVALFLPLVLLRLRDRKVLPVAAGLAAGVAAQLVATVQHPRPRPDAEVPGVLDQAKGYLLNVVVPLWKPSVDGPGGFVAERGWWFVIALALPFALVCVGLLVVVLRSRRSWSDGRVVAVAAIALGATGPFVGALVLNPGPQLQFDAFSLAQLSERMPLRYGVVPAMFLTAGVWLWIDWCGRRNRWTVVASGVLVVAVVAPQLWHLAPDGTRRSEGPGWSVGVDDAQDACRAGTAPPPVGAAPKKDWAVALSCATLAP